MYYIAYGSNLNVLQMSKRCPFAVKVGSAVIPGYKLLFRGSKTGSYLTIEKADGYEVPVGVWKITSRDEAELDRYEGFPYFYYKKTFLLPCSDGKRHRCMAYIMHEDRPLGVPSQIYMDVCAKGYEDFGFDPRYLYQAYEDSL